MALAHRVVLLCLSTIAFLSGFAATPVQAQQADLVINQSDSPDPGPAGGNFTYSVRVDNNGPNTATSVVLSDTLPPGSTFVSATPTQGSCTGPVGGVITCNLGTLAFTSSATVNVVVVLPTPGVHVNTATATSATADPNATNNTNDPESTTAQNAADMTLTIVDSPDPVAAGAPFTYAVTAVNNGPTNTASQQIAFTVPTGACVTSAPSGGGWACTPPAGGFPHCSGTFTCNRAAGLNVGASAPALTVPMVSNIGGTITSSFAVSSNLPDGDPTDNTVTESTTSTGGSVDLQVTKVAAPTTVAMNNNVTFTITARRNGGVTPTGISILDNLPVGFTYQSASGTGWTCPAGPIPGPALIACTRPTYAGANFTNMPAITMIATATVAGTHANVADIDSDQDDPVLANNTSSVNVTVSNDADLSLTKTASLNPVTVGQDFNYTLTVRNNGPVALVAGSVITVTDTIEPELTLRGLPSGTGWSCALDPPATPPFPVAGPVSFTCTRTGALAINTNASAITVPVEASVEGALSNTACAALGGPGPTDPVAANNCQSRGGTATAVANSADLQVMSKVAAPDPVNSGSILTYTITVRNNGPQPVPDAVVSDTLSSLRSSGPLPGLVSATATQGTCTPAGPMNTTNVTVSCNLGALGVGQVEAVTIQVRPAVANTGNRANTATINSPTVGDNDRSNNTGSVNSTVNAVADVTVTKTDTPDPAQAGTPLVYTITARAANGLSNAQNVQINDVMPANVTFVSLGAVSGSGSCSSIPAAGSIGQTLTCAWPAINANSQQTVTYTVRPLTGEVLVSNDVAVSTATIETDATNNTAASTTTITPAAVDLIINKADDVDPVALGAIVRYTIRVENAGPSHATNVVMTDVFPAPAPPASPTTATFSYQGNLATTPSPGGLAVNCVEPPPDATTGSLACTIPDLPAGGVVLVQYDMRADAIAGPVSGTIFNHAAVTANETETLAANNQTTHSTTARLPVDLAIDKSALAPSVNQGATLDWQVAVTNNGPNNSTGAVLTDTLPAGVAFDSIVSTTGAGSCSHAAGTFECTLGTLSTGDTFMVVFRVQLANPYGGANPLLNTASVATVNEIDTNPANNSDDASTPIVISTLTVAKAFGAASYTPGSTGTWTVIVGNTGPAAAAGVSLGDTLPAGVSLSGPWSCVPSGAASCPASGGVAGDTALAFSGASVPVGQTLTVTVPVAFSPALVANPVVNTADVTGDSSPPASASSPVPRLANVGLGVAKTDGSLTYTPGGTAVYVVTVTNAGPTDATDVLVTDNLPAGVTLSAAVSCTPMGAATCGAVVGASGDTAWSATANAIPAGGAHSLVFNVPVAFDPAMLTDPLVNQVDATDVPSGTTVSATDSDTRASDVTLAVVKTDGSATYTPGGTATYTVTVTNTGLSAATGATVSDTFPTGMTSTAAVTCAASGVSACGTLATAIGATSFTDTGALVLPGAGNAVTYTVPVAYAADLLTDPLVNTADVVDVPSGAVGSGSDNDTRSADVTLVVTKTDNAASYTPGGTATYEITVTNTGLTDATSVTVADTLPAGVLLTAPAACVAGGTADCGTVTGAAGEGAFGAAGAILPAGAGNILTFTVPVSFDPAMTDDPLINSVTATDVPTGSNAMASDSDTLTPAANLAVTKTDGATGYVPGGGATYVIVVTNGGVSAANDITVDDPLPAGVTLAGVPTCVAAGTATCGTIVGTVGGNVFGAIGATLFPGPGNSLTYTVPVSFAPGMSTTPLVNTVTVSDPGSPTTNASDSNVLGPSLAKTIAPAVIVNGGMATLTLALGNPNALPMTLTAAFVDDMPAGVTTASGQAGTCAGVTVTATQVVMASGSTIPPGGCTIVVSITSTTPGVVTNTTGPLATSEGTAPPASAPLTITIPGGPPNPDLAITKTALGTFFQGQVGAQYTLAVANVGGVPTVSPVTVTDVLPPQLTATSIAGAGWACTQPSGPCVRGDVLAPGASYPTLALTVNVASSAAGLIVNEGIVSGGGDPNPTNNSSSAAITVTAGEVTSVPVNSPWMLAAMALMLAFLGWRSGLGARRR